MANKCVVKGCPNKTDEGHFVGDICAACYAHITTGRVGPTQSFLKVISEMTDKLNEIESIVAVGKSSALHEIWNILKDETDGK